MANIRRWSTTPASNNFSTTLGGWPENMLASSVNNCARQNLADIKGTFLEYPFFDYGDDPTYISSTTFSVLTNLTSRYKVGQRIRWTEEFSSNVYYGKITSVAYVSVTTITVAPDSTSLNGNLDTFGVELAPGLDSLPVGTTAGGTTVYTISLPGITAYHDKVAFFGRINAANTGASTINVNSLGAKNIYKGGTTAVASGDLALNTTYGFVYDGTGFQVVGIGGSGAAIGGSTTHVQYNNTGALAGNANFTYNGSGIATLTTGLVVGGNATASGYVDFKEDTDNGTNKITVTAPSAIASDKTQTLQDITGTIIVTGGTDLTVPDGGIGVSSLTAYAPMFGGTTSTGPVQSGTVGTAGQVLMSNGAGALPTFAGKAIMQQVYTQNTTPSSTTSLIPADNTIPQITEGAEFLTQAITPTNASNILVIDVLLCGGVTTVDQSCVALFQDSTANALRSSIQYSNLSAGNYFWLRHIMAAGTTSSTTFRVRAGRGAAGTFYVNQGPSGTALFGGTVASTIVVTEYAV